MGTQSMRGGLKVAGPSNGLGQSITKNVAGPSTGQNLQLPRVSWVKCLKENKWGTSFEKQPQASIWRQSARWHETFLVCTSGLPNSISPYPSQTTRTTAFPLDKRHEFLARSLWSFKTMTWRPGQNETQSQDKRRRYSSEKSLQEQAQRLVGSGWKAGKDFFFLKTEDYICLH